MPEAGRCGVDVPALNAFSLVASIMNARCAIQFGVNHFLRIYRLCYRVLTASPPMGLLLMKPAKVLLSFTGPDSKKSCNQRREGLSGTCPGLQKAR